MTADTVPLTAPTLDDLPGIRHGFFTRRGGVSRGLYASLNCGYGSGDDRDAVRQNRRRSLAALGADCDDVTTAFQVHSARAVLVSEPWNPGDGPRADAMVATAPNVALGILTADCAPVLFADPEARVIGAAHAGWRGALDGIIRATISRMCEAGAALPRIKAAIGPCIGPDSYEVGPEFPGPFLERDSRADRFFQPRDGNRLSFDLAGYVTAELAKIGVGQIAIVARDTCAEEASFFSYRRTCHQGGGDYGRNLSVILLED